MTKKHKMLGILFSFLVVIAGLYPVTAFATLLAPGSSLPPDVFAVNPFTLAGAALVDTTTKAFLSTPTGLVSGSVTQNVYLVTAGSAASLAFGPAWAAQGGIGFEYLVSTNASDTDQVRRVTMANFGTFAVDAGFVVGAGATPTTVDRSATGSTVGFNYAVGSGIGPGAAASNTLIVQTNSPTYTNGLFSAINSETATVGVFGIVPEPTSLLLLGAGLAGLGLWRRQMKG